MAASGLNVNTLLDRCEADFKHEDRSVRLMCAQRISAAASCIDDAGLRKRLLGIVSEQSGDEDEILYTLAGQCGEVFDKWGGSSCDEELAFEILLMLTTIGGTEETVVREEVGKSFTHIVTTAGGRVAQRAAEECFSQLSSASWFTGRVTACLVVPGLCKACDAGTRDKVVEAYEKLCADSTPMVRRASARVLADAAHAFGGSMNEATESLFVSLMKKLGLEGEESIRLKALDKMDTLFSALPTKGIALAQEVATRCAEEASWKMRCAFTKQFVAISKIVFEKGSDDFDSAAISKMLLGLLRDPEPEVVVAAIGQIAGSLSHFKDQAPIVESLSTLMQGEGQENIRQQIATCIVDMMCNEEATATPDGLLIDLIESLLKDENEMTQVTLLDAYHRIYASLFDADPAGTKQMRSRLVGELQKISQGETGERWRLRDCTCTAMANIAAKEYSDGADAKEGSRMVDNAAQLLVDALDDDVAAVRASAAEGLVLLATKTDSAMAVLLKTVQGPKMAKSGNYLRRLLVATALNKMADTKHPKLCDTDLHAKLYNALVSDKVINVAFSACKMLHAMKQMNPKLHSSTLDSCKGSIEQLAGSNDPDCEFFAKLCLGRVDETGRDI